MPRRAARVDENQAAIVVGLRAYGCSVQSLASCGRGVPDLMVGLRGANYLLEVKNPDQDASHRKLTPDEATWHQRWGGQVAVVMDLREALEVVGIKPVD